MNMNKFSVAMCVYGKDNPEHFIQAVDSVWTKQTVKPDEMVLVVDGPVPDELKNIICEYERDSNFRVIWFAENQGHGHARRAGLAACKNEIVALMDADDISLPHRFESQLPYFEDSAVDIVGGDIAEFIEEESNIVAFRQVPMADKDIKICMKDRCPFNQMSVMFRKSAYEEAGGYIDWYCEEDYYLWLRMMQEGAIFANTGTVLVNVRVGDDMYRRRGGLRYFSSEAKLQKYMLDQGIISVGTYIKNVGKRLIVQVLMPNRLRGWVFKKFARKTVR